MSALFELSGVAPEAVAVDDGERVVTWGELEARSARFGNGLEAMGAAPGSHVAVCVSNRTEFVEAVLGAWRAGCAYTPLKTGWTADEVGAVLDDAGSTVVVTDRDGARAAATARGLPVVDLDADFETWLAGQSDVALPDDRRGYKLTYTSGTTGRPKGVLLSGSGVADFATGWRGIARWAELLQLPGDGTHVFLSRLFNGAPQTFGFGAMARGATLRILRRWDPAAALAALSSPDVTSTIMVPTMFRQLLALDGVDRSKAPSTSLRTVLHGGEPCPIPLKEAMLDWFGDVLVEYYGYSEGGMTIATAAEWRERPGTVGRPTPGLAVKILDANGDTLPAGQTGQVYFESDSGPRFAYKDAADKTAAAYRGSAFTVGDVGHVDDAGYLYLSGRSTDVVVSAGVNVYPAEIEQALCGVPGVSDMCVVGAPDEERGEVPVLYVSLPPAAHRTEVLAALDATAKEQLAPYKRPRSVTVVEEIPRDQTGKLLRRVLRDPLWSGQQPCQTQRR